MCTQNRRESAILALQKAIDHNRVDDDVINKINSGAMTFQNGTITVRKALGNVSGTQDITEESVSKTLGVTNLDRGELSKGTIFVVTSIAIASMANADVNGDEYSPLLADPELYASDFDLSQDGVKFFIDEPVANYHVGAAPATPADKFVELAEPIVLVDGQFIDLDLKIPDALQANTNVEFLFAGYRTGRK